MRRRSVPPPTRSTFSLALALCALVLSALVGGCSGDGAPAGSPERPGLLVITMDTTRQDRLGCYGYERARTPRLDDLASRAAVFDQAIAQCPVTLPSHASMFTGNLPSYHGVRGNGTYTLPEEQTTLAEMLRDAGYQTAAVVASEVLDRRYGLAQGFDRYDDEQGEAPSPFHYPERRAHEVTRAALQLARGFDRGRPWFLWVHYFDPHGRYDPPDEFRRHFPADTGGLYDGEIAAMDHAIGELLDGLRDTGLLRGAVIAALADHGEGFPGPHAEETHGMLLYRDTLEIPFLIAAEGRIEGGRRIEAMASTADLTPTLLDLLGIEAEEPFQGRSLAPLLEEEEPRLPPSLVYAETIAPFDFYGWSPLYQVRDRAWKLVLGPRSELYDLASDPDQLDDVSKAHPGRVASMKEDLIRLAEPSHPSIATTHTLDAEQRRRLEAMGYLVKGGAPVPAFDELAGLGDPARLIHLQEPIEEARKLSIGGKHREAMDVIREVLDVDPRNVEGWNLLSKFALDAGETEIGIAALEKLRAQRPDQLGYLVRLADAKQKHAARLRDEGRTAEAARTVEEAIALYEEAAGRGSEEIGVYVNLGSLFLRRRDPVSAERHLRTALEIDPERFEAHLNLAAALASAGRFEDALPSVERAARLASTPQQARAAQTLRSRIHSRLPR